MVKNVTTDEQMLKLCELRHSLLLTLGGLHNPEYALTKLDEFRADVGKLGIAATVEKWSDFIRTVRI